MYESSSNIFIFCIICVLDFKSFKANIYSFKIIFQTLSGKRSTNRKGKLTFNYCF